MVGYLAANPKEPNALRLAFSTINDALGAQPDAQLARSLPEQVRNAVTYGRPVGT